MTPFKWGEAATCSMVESIAEVEALGTRGSRPNPYKRLSEEESEGPDAQYASRSSFSSLARVCACSADKKSNQGLAELRITHFNKEEEWTGLYLHTSR
jgi:hypothetical protein